MTIKTAVKAIVLLAALSDLDEPFEVGASTLRVRNPEFLKVCFAGDFTHALKEV